MRKGRIEERDFWLAMLLSIVTCGIYGIYFFYVMNEDVNELCKKDGKENMNYILVLLLSFVTCGIYYFVWLYQQGDRLQRAGREEYGLFMPNTGSTIALWAVLGTWICGIGTWVSYYLLIDNFNIVAREYNKQFPGENFSRTDMAGGAKSDAASETFTADDVQTATDGATYVTIEVPDDEVETESTTNNDSNEK